MDAPNESLLDYSVWRRQLIDLEKKSNSSRDPLMSQVKVMRVGGDDAAVEEEEKDPDQAAKQEFLLNYTFDMSLDDHMARAGSLDGQQ